LKLSLIHRYNRECFAHREVVAPVGLWERGVGVSGYPLPSTRPLPKHPSSIFPSLVSSSENHRAPKAFATSPSGETGLSTYSLLVDEEPLVVEHLLFPFPNLFNDYRNGEQTKYKESHKAYFISNHRIIPTYYPPNKINQDKNQKNKNKCPCNSDSALCFNLIHFFHYPHAPLVKHLGGAL